MGDRELNRIDKELTSLLEICLNPGLTSLNLHCNRITRIEGLNSTCHLRHLDLSSNRISQIEGLSSLVSLRTLNLSCNLIRKVEGLSGLVNLTELDLSYNRISDLTGLLYLHGTDYKLKHISLQSNCLDNVNHLLQCLLGLQSLREVTLNLNGIGNPLCSTQGYREIVVQSLPQITVLDGLDRHGNPPDIPTFEDCLDFLLSSDTSSLAVVGGSRPHITTPRIDEVLNQFRHRITSELTNPDDQPHHSSVADAVDDANEQRIRNLEQQISKLAQKRLTPADKSTSSTPTMVTQLKTKRDTNRTSESESDIRKETTKRSRIPKRRCNTAVRMSTKEAKGKRTISDGENHKTMSSKSPLGARRKGGDTSGLDTAEPMGFRLGVTAAKSLKDVNAKPVEERETYRVIVEERDQERERRWKAELAVRKLTEQLKCLQEKVSEEKDLKSMTLNATDRLKDILVKERSERSGLQSRVQELEEKCQDLKRELERTRSSEDQLKTALHGLEDNVSQAETLWASQKAEELKRYQELERRASTQRRELDLQRATVRQHRERLQQLHELLTAREQEHRKELQSRLVPGGPDFCQAVAKEVASVEEKHSYRQEVLEEKLAEGHRQYAALEDEFRMALTIEASRFSEVKEAYDHERAEVMELRTALTQSNDREKKTGSLVQELTAVVKEQKSRIAELIKAKKNLKGRLHSLEAEIGQEQRLHVQLELLKKDKARLMSQVTAQESVIDGLRAERKIWGQELAQQGAGLAHDRGLLEARIEMLSTELDTQKKQNENDINGLKIKTKIIDDQTDTIRKLKEALLERDEQTRKLREEMATTEKRLRHQLDEETAQVTELMERLEQYRLRKEELKQELEEKEAELHEIKHLHSASSKKRQEKEELLTQLESQVKRMKEENYSKEKLLLEEREKEVQLRKAAVEKLHRVDDAFRQQLESVQQLANKKQKQIEQANERVFQVEEEMRHLLMEVESCKRNMQEKEKRLASALRDFQYES